ncbi:MTRF1L release factor glutamine methyltransferase-like isoform X3 [Halichondria panicea]|uniref:MTRF1L release factor glutamine methyltransferase-like isoform X3 n=1 Tax=Halichondria panicea TaxID=6063 RepID=UPI00312B8623
MNSRCRLLTSPGPHLVSWRLHRAKKKHAAVRLHIVRAMCGGRTSGGWAFNDQLTLRKDMTGSVCFKGASLMSLAAVNNHDISVSGFKSHWVKVLTHREIPDPYWSVKWITEHVQKTIVQSDSSPQVPHRAHWLSREQVDAANTMLSQRLLRVPVQYIIGEWDFRTLTLAMRPPVFIPEPETEELVGLVLDELLSDQSRGDVKFLDLCCGSGAIAISLLTECAQMSGHALDISEEAVMLTRENATKHGVSDRLHTLHCPLDECLQQLEEHRVTFDLIISNPPYIASSRLPHVQAEVQRYVDQRALDGGDDGLRPVAKILSISKHLLSEEGQLWLETDTGQANDIQRLLLTNHSSELEYSTSYNDFTNRSRFHKLTRRK